MENRDIDLMSKMHAFARLPRAAELIAEDFGDDRDSWLKARRAGIGGSEIAGILGLSKWSTPLSIWRDKVGLGVEVEPSWPMKQGTHNESLIADEWARLNNCILHELPFLRDADHPHRCASVDRLAIFPDGHVEIIEIKYSGRGVEDIPDYYYTQVLWYMALTGVHQARLVVADFFHEPEGRIVEWDAETADKLIDAVDEFWSRYVEGDEAPEPTTTEEKQEAAFEKIAASDGEVVADSEMTDIAERLKAAKDDKAQAEAMIKAFELQLAEMMARAGARKIEGDGWKATYTETKGRVSYSAYIKDAGVPADELEKYRGKTSRSLRVTFK